MVGVQTPTGTEEGGPSPGMVLGDRPTVSKVQFDLYCLVNRTLLLHGKAFTILDYVRAPAHEKNHFGAEGGGVAPPPIRTWV